MRAVYGISDTDRKYHSIGRAREVPDYEPRDSSADHADEELVEE